MQKVPKVPKAQGVRTLINPLPLEDTTSSYLGCLPLALSFLPHPPFPHKGIPAFEYFCARLVEQLRSRGAGAPIQLRGPLSLPRTPGPDPLPEA